MLEELMKKEREKRKNSAENNLINANTKLMDQLKWIREDIEKEMNKLSQYDDELIHEIIDDLEKILKNNN